MTTPTNINPTTIKTVAPSSPDLKSQLPALPFTQKPQKTKLDVPLKAIKQQTARWTDGLSRLSRIIKGIPVEAVPHHPDSKALSPQTMQSRETDRFWNHLWQDHDYYATHDIKPETDGISQLLDAVFQSSRPGQTVLEVGSGPSTRLIPIAKKYGLKLTLVDRLESAHVAARKRAERYGIQCDHVIGDATNLPFETPFNFVVSIGLNEHFFGRERSLVFEEQYRLTAPNGYMAVIVPNKFGSMLLEQFEKEFLGTYGFGPAALFSCFELIDITSHLKLNDMGLYGVSVMTSWIRLLPQHVQREIFANQQLWKKMVNLPGNFAIDSILNTLFGEEIMVIGRKPAPCPFPSKKDALKFSY